MVLKTTFNGRIAIVSILKSFLTTTLAPFVGAKFVLDASFVDSFIVAIVSGLIMGGVSLANILGRYQRYLEDKEDEKIR